MSLRLSTFAIALVVVVNALVLAGVVWNRSGQPAAVLELTERELALPYGRWGDRESTGVALSIVRSDRDDWLDRDKLAELGFDVDHYEGPAAERRVYAVLEFDGPAFAELLAEQRTRLAQARDGLETGETNRREVETAEAALERLEQSGSRLVVVDAGLKADPLRLRYPERERYVVMQALVRVNATRLAGRNSDAVVRGYVGELLPGRIHVPRRFHGPLRQATDDRGYVYDTPPRYRVVIKFGRRGEPWVAGIEPMPAQNESS